MQIVHELGNLLESHSCGKLSQVETMQLQFKITSPFRNLEDAFGW